jgi:phosphoesterase RecJ-like protein
MRLRGEVLARINLVNDGKLGHTHVLKSDFDRLQALPSDTEDLVNLVLEIDGTQAAVIFIELVENTSFKVSFRSRCKLDCSQVAGHFGGGGHKAAAGATIEGKLAELQASVLDAVRAGMT